MNFTYKWNLQDLKKVKKNKLKVFSCFACGGGSTMGYKMSGYDVIGCNEIEQKIAEVYSENHKPRHLYIMPIQKFKKMDHAEELYNLDILDGSPPCSSFSTAGARERKWGTASKFREGQIKQHLDDLFFDFIDLAEELQPKVVIAENVKGMLLGNAKGYVKQVVQRMSKIGYKTQIFLLNGATMGLPQKRERVFFISHKTNKKIKLNFNENPVSVKEAFDSIQDINTKGKCMEDSANAKYWHMCKPGENFAKYHPTKSLFSSIKIQRNTPSSTVLASEGLFHYESNRRLSKQELCVLGSYPLDYNFKDYKPNYLIGMSVPPLMMHKVSAEVRKQIFGV